MLPAVIALVFALIGACAIYGLRQDVRTGVARDEIYQFNRDHSPAGFAAILAGKVLICGLCLGEIGHALNLCGDPFVLLKAVFG